ncbi:MAG: zinc-binding alcohol dehydrogenase family protein [Bacteroidales bacterium]|nr:zinc-binding alcohol dehydrogenase family protein [Bacteroidales bacterium]
MKAIKILKPGEMKILEQSIPRYGDDDILVKLKYVGFCGSDLNTFLGKNSLVKYPVIPGHEISGIISHIGNNVPHTYKIGDKITVIPYTNCGQCSSCKRGKFNACRYNQTLGVQRDGAMVEYLVIPWQKALIENQLSDCLLALVEPLTVGFHAVDNGKVTDADMVMVLGCGMIGSGAIIRASRRGATVIAVDIDDYKLETAKILGAGYTINSKKENLHEKLEKITIGNGPDVVIEAAGSPATYQTAIEEVAFGGRMVCIGYTNEEVNLPTRLWVQKELDIIGSRNANPIDFESVIKYLKSGNLNENLLISKIVKPEEAPIAMKEWSRDQKNIFKVLVQF